MLIQGVRDFSIHGAKKPPALNGLPDIDQCHELSRVIHNFQKSSHNVVVIVISC